MNLTSPRVIEQLMSKFNLKFDRSLGQNFLIDQNILNKILDTVPADSIVLEIGSGLGTVTQGLLQNNYKVISVEISSRLCNILKEIFAEYGNLDIINQDILSINTHHIIQSLKQQYPEKKIVIIGNLPYYITTPIMFKFLESKWLPNIMTFVVQKEVAERIVSKPNSKNYGSLSVAVQYYGVPKLIHKIPASCFIPAPKVDSAIVQIELKPQFLSKTNTTPLNSNTLVAHNTDLFFKLVKSVFGYRRKNILSAIKYAQKEGSFNYNINRTQLQSILDSVKIDHKIRGENLSVEQLVNISNMINSCIL